MNAGVVPNKGQRIDFVFCREEEHSVSIDTGWKEDKG